MVTKSLAGPMTAFRSALATTAEQIRGILTNGEGGENGRVERFSGELGEFASGRIDIDRFSKLFEPQHALNPVNAQRIDRAYLIMSELIAHGDDTFLLNVEEGGNLRDSVAKMLEHLGTAFGAARVVELSRTGRYKFGEHAKYVSAFPFARWNAAERRIAPPLIVLVDGADVNAGGLAEFLDGAQKIVLLVRGAASPAPLARLITPHTFVVQTADSAGLERFGQWEGPGIAAVMPENAARFVHDPAAAPARRLVVDFVPDPKPRKALRGISSAQQAEELQQLVTLRNGSSVPGSAAQESAAAGPAAAAVAPVDKLAAWLLQQADLSGIG